MIRNMKNSKRARAAAIIVNNQNVLVIQRISKGKEYYVFPGGGVEKGESLKQAVIREVREETSLEVRIEKLLYHYYHPDRKEDQFFYLCRYLAGKPKLSDCEELEEMKNGADNFYLPLWSKIVDLPQLLLYPLEVRDWFMKDIKREFKGVPKKMVVNFLELRRKL